MLKLINVLYNNNTYDVINSKKLEESIVSGNVKKFFRSSGWVTISVGPIRKNNSYHLTENRDMGTH